VTDSTPDGIRKHAEIELREEIGYRPGQLEKLLDFYSHPGYIAHKVHLIVAHELEWDPLGCHRESCVKRNLANEELLSR
jgi:8-oxo-dGTP pyrophosphatase MutT (NUDIX family)